MLHGRIRARLQMPNAADIGGDDTGRTGCTQVL